MPSFVENPVAAVQEIVAKKVDSATAAPATEIPGPVSKEGSSKLNSVWDARAVHFVVDYDQSQGN